jgi:hypothetical protein
MSFTQEYSECAAILGVLNSDQRAAGNYNTAWADVSTYHRAAVIINVGDMAATATLNVIIQEAQDAAGTGVAAIAGKAITQLTQAGGDGDDIVIMELRSEELTPGFDFIRAQATVANAAVDLALEVVGLIPRFPPVPLTNVTEVVA